MEEGTRQFLRPQPAGPEWDRVLPQGNEETAAIADEEFRDDLEREFDNSETIRAFVRVAAVLVT